MKRRSASKIDAVFFLGDIVTFWTLHGVVAATMPRSPNRIISRRTRRNRTVHRVLLWSDDSDFDRFAQRIHDRRPDSGSSEKTVPSIHDAVEARSRCDGR